MDFANPEWTVALVPSAKTCTNHVSSVLDSKMSLRDTRKAIGGEAKREQLLTKLEADHEKHGQDKMRQVKSKNIMIIGRTRSGKSTIKSLLVDPTQVPDELTLKSGTRDAHIESYYITGREVTLNIIDTPGLFERGSEDNDIRDNDAIMQTIERCANMEITSFDAICFCVAITAGINGDDVKSIELFMKLLGGDISSNSCLIITHCESKSEGQRKMIVRELSEDKFFKEIAPFFKRGIFFSGSINRDNYNNGNECIIDEYVCICEYRTKLIELFSENIKPFPITSSQISTIRRANEAKEEIEQQLQNAQNACEEEKGTTQYLSTESRYKDIVIKRLQSKCEQDGNVITNLQNKCEEMDRVIKELKGDFKEHQGTIACLRQECERKTKSLEDSQNELKDRDKTISGLTQHSQPRISQGQRRYPRIRGTKTKSFARV